MYYHKLPQSYVLFYDGHKTKLLENHFFSPPTDLAFRKATGLVKASYLYVPAYVEHMLIQPAYVLQVTEF